MVNNIYNKNFYFLFILKFHFSPTNENGFCRSKVVHSRQAGVYNSACGPNKRFITGWLGLLNARKGRSFLLFVRSAVCPRSDEHLGVSYISPKLSLFNLDLFGIYGPYVGLMWVLYGPCRVLLSRFYVFPGGGYQKVRRQLFCRGVLLNSGGASYHTH